MIRILFLALSFILLTFGAQAQKEEVLKPVYQLFLGMEKADSVLVRKVFTQDAKMYTGYVDKNGQALIKEGSVDEFVMAIGKKDTTTPAWVEKLYNTEVRIDGNVAQVWTDYSFFLGTQFIHCGVDAFQLVKQEGVWKILHIMDTRRKENCKQD